MIITRHPFLKDTFAVFHDDAEPPGHRYCERLATAIARAAGGDLSREVIAELAEMSSCLLTLVGVKDIERACQLRDLHDAALARLAEMDPRGRVS